MTANISSCRFVSLRNRMLTLSGRSGATDSNANRERSQNHCRSILPLRSRLRQPGYAPVLTKAILGWVPWTRGNSSALAGYDREKGEKIRHKGHIWGVYVKEKWRGKGLGKAQMLELLR